MGESSQTIDRASVSSASIVTEIAERTDASPLELPPLYEAIDSDALDTLVRDGESCHVTFEYAGHEVTVSETGVSIREIERDDPDKYRGVLYEPRQGD